MPTPIPTTYQLYLDPLLGFTPGGTSWADQSVNENDFTFTNTSYTYENTIGSFLFTPGTSTVANENIQPGSLPLGQSAITIICWVKLTLENIPLDDFSFFSIGRSPAGATAQLINLGVQVGNFGAGDARNITVFNRGGQKTSSSLADDIPYNTWTMISYTKPVNGTVADQLLYKNASACSTYSTVNGTRVVDTSLAGGNDPRVRINSTTNPIVSSAPFSLGQLWIYNQVLTAGDISNFYDVTYPRYYPSPPAPDLSNGRSYQQGFSG
jgi:hypothetical protein